MTFYPIKVQDIIDETGSARSFILQPAVAQRPTFRYQPGQFLTLHVPQPENSERSQSVYFSSNPETNKQLKITVIHETAEHSSNWIYNNLKVGDNIKASAPRGNFNIKASSNALGLIVDDNGIIPIISLLKSELLNSLRTIKLFYGCNSYDSIIFRQEIDDLRKRYPQQFDCLYHLNIGISGLDSSTLKNFINNCRQADFYICGLSSHVNVAEHALADLDVDEHHIHIENCSSLSNQGITSEKSLPLRLSPCDISHFRATLDGKEYTINYLPDKTLLECILAAGLDPYFSCSDAHCGYCMAIKKSGELTMQKTNVLSPGDIDRGYILLCQAIPLSEDVWVDCDA